MQDGREELDTPPLDVGAILEALRAHVREQRLVQSRAMPSPLERDLLRSLDEIELYRVVSAHWPLLGATLPQRAIALINKLVRRYLRWYINPIVEQQNAYNDAVARTLRLLAEAYGDLAEQLPSAQAGTPDPPAPGAHSQPPATDAPHQPAVSTSLPADTATLMAVVRTRAAAEPPARFPDLDLRALEPQLRLQQTVSAHWPLPATTFAQEASTLVNKLVRRYLRWYINPIIEQQNAANAAFLAALTRLIALDATRRAVIARYRARHR
jgi:predicted nucleic acid-binding protein